MSSIIPECEVIFEDGEDALDKRYNDCQKNPGHPNFIPVEQFRPEHLPTQLRTDKILQSIKRKCNRTVRIVVMFTSKDRPNTFHDGKSPYPFSKFKGSKKKRRYGTGYIVNLNRRNCNEVCPCPVCQEAPDPKMEFWMVHVQTSTHVIYDTSEAKCSQFDCFYDSDDDVEDKKLYGVRTCNERFVPGSHYTSDSVRVLCVTHDSKLVRRLSKDLRCTVDEAMNWSDFLYSPEEVIVSHPHGCGKRITVGHILHVTCSANKPRDRFIAQTICRLPIKQKQSQDYVKLLSSQIKCLFIPFTDNLIGTKLTTYYLKGTPVATNYSEDIYNILIAMACGFYKFALFTNWFYGFFFNAECLELVVSSLMLQRLHNMEMSGIKSVELIDVGLLLWKCYFILIHHLLRDLSMRFKEERNHDHLDIVISYFLENIYEFKPELISLFDLKQHICEKSEEYFIRDCIYSDMNDAERVLVRILTGVFVCKNDNDDFIDDDDDDDDSKMIVIEGGFFGDILSKFIFKGFTNFDSICNYRQFNNEKKTTIGPESKDFFQPGTKFLVPSNMIYELPPQAKYSKKYDKGNSDYFTLPPGTKFYLKSPAYLDFPLPDGAEFLQLDCVESDEQVIYYSTDTCPGSSGACVYCDIPKRGYRFYQPHSGTDGKENCTGKIEAGANMIKYHEIENYMKEKLREAFKR